MYYPQTDGQTECINQELEQYLWLFTNERQDNWDKLLPLAEFQYNHVYSSTQQTPFLLDSGRVPQMGFELHQTASKVKSVNKFIDQIKGVLKEACSALLKSKDDMVHYYNQHHDPAPTFKKGDLVFLDALNIKTTWPSKKLSHRYLGPFTMVKSIGTHAYHLWLPQSLSRLYPVFHVSKLQKQPEDMIEGHQTHHPPLPTIIEGNIEYDVEAVLDSRV